HRALSEHKTLSISWSHYPFLTKNGVNERQGFLFAKPMPAAAFERWYRRHLSKKLR
ncbi:MAG: hypothetical protein ACTIA0_21410, partial [Citrobacter braakii]